MTVSGGAILSERGTLDSIQVMRGFAAVLIVIYHALKETVSLYGLTNFSAGQLEPLIYGIDLFFVISGFIMIYTSPAEFNASAAKTFMLKRIARIVPLYWFFITLLVIAYFILPQQLDYLGFNINDVVKTYLFIPYYNGDGILMPFYKVGWTLNYEMYFYALFAFFMLIPKRFFMIALTIALLVPVFFMRGSAEQNEIIHFISAPIVLNFLSGIWIGFMVKKGIALPTIIKYLGVLVIAASLIWLIFAAQIYAATGLSFPQKTFAALTIALIVLPRGAFDMKMPKFAGFLGDSSYSLYLSHSFAIGVLVVCIGQLDLTAHVAPWLFCGLCLFLSISAGSVSFLLIEKPMLRLSKSYILRQNKNLFNR
ncbi:MAG: acyltransferase [Alphaproteobacteria bacterium]|nr:acyltransferase [Alphaproteobacteria bacterium]NCQ88109.1 acyltransferase [Alphaproteobacteria bacterium]NCT05384.1 acyltransferase [Alphaproteobacteria bacterium]